MKGKQQTLLLEELSIFDNLHLIYSNKPVDLVIVTAIARRFEFYDFRVCNKLCLSLELIQ